MSPTDENAPASVAPSMNLRTGMTPLPDGYEAQPVRGERDPTGRFHYEFFRVYGPPDPSGGLGPVCELDKDRCFWGVTWSMPEADGQVQAAGRAVSYREARRRRGASMTFDRFSLLTWLNGGLADLLPTRDLLGASDSGAG